MQRREQVGFEASRVVVQIAPRDARRSPPGREQRAVASAVALEGPSRAVRLPAVELDDEALRSP